MITVDFVPYAELNKLKFEKTSLVGGIGVFDGVHLGHQLLIEKILLASKESGYKSTIITFYPPTRFLLGKNRYLLTTNIEKVALFEKFGIERVIIFEFTEEFSKMSPLDFLDIIRRLGIRILYVGRDFRFGYKRSGDVGLMKKILNRSKIYVEGVDILSLRDKKVSSTDIKEFILQGEIQKANRYLGYNFFVTGIPYRKGRKIILITHINKIKPGDGIYRVLVKDSEESFVLVKDEIIYLSNLSYEQERGIMEISFLKKEEKAIKNSTWEFTEKEFYAKLY